MTTTVDIANKALQSLGLQKKISSLTQDSAEAQSIALIIDDLRQDLLRMAPWNCGTKTANLTYITSSPGTPENPIAGTTLWEPGQPPPPWNYEYQYPVDCLRPCWVIPATQTGFAGGIPITTAVTGGAASFWQGPPVKFAVQTDTFVPVTAASVTTGGSGYAINDIITLATPTFAGANIGAPAQLVVTGVNTGAITAVAVISQIPNTGPAAQLGGSYFAPQPNPVPQGSTTGSGIGASFTLAYGSPAPQRVILTNQEFAILTYVQNVTDPDVMDTLFQRAWVSLVAAHTAISITQDISIANAKIQLVNSAISQARTADGNEGMLVNDITPDWIRIRGIDFTSPYSGPFTGFDWGGMYPIFG